MALVPQAAVPAVVPLLLSVKLSGPCESDVMWEAGCQYPGYPLPCDFRGEYRSGRCMSVSCPPLFMSAVLSCGHGVTPTSAGSDAGLGDSLCLGGYVGAGRQGLYYEARYPYF